MVETCLIMDSSIKGNLELPFCSDPSLLVFLIILIVILCICSFGLQYTYRKKLKKVLHREAEIKNFLNIFSQNIQKSGEVTKSMTSSARYVADLCEAAAVCIYKVEDGNLRVCGYCGAFPPMMSIISDITRPRYVFEALRREKIPLGSGVIGQIAINREPLLLVDALREPLLDNAQRIVSIRTLMAVPLIADDKIYGVVCAINSRRNEGTFSIEQFHRFCFISKQLLVALNITEAYSNMAEQERISQELDFARRLQSSLLPDRFPPWYQYTVRTSTRPAKEVSGDFYDFVNIDEDRLLVVIGDACGKGIPACMVMAMTRTFIRSNIENFTTLRNLLFKINDNLYRDTAEELFLTMACCLIDRKNDTIEFARAGHTGIILNVRSHNRVIFPDGTALGLLPSDMANFETLTIQSTPGSSILLYTDGISEAQNEDGEEFGIERIKEIVLDACVIRLNPESINAQLLQVLDTFTGDPDLERQADDQTLVLIRHS